MWESERGEIEAFKIKESMDELFKTTHTGSVSLYGKKPLSFTAYLANQGNEIWLTSKETTEHVAAINNGVLDVAVCVWRQPKEWGDPLYGIQLTGAISLVVDVDGAERGLKALHARFPGTIETLPSVDRVLGDNKVTCLQKILLSTGKIRDEVRIGKGAHGIAWNGIK